MISSTTNCSMASTSASPSPKSPSEANEKTKKYDRQLRLWGEHGQSKLESGHVCLLNASAVGTEVLKSLVLSGIGNFTIVDDNPVTQQDIGNNFFLDADCLGKNRGESACRLLLELNPDVTGSSINENSSTLLFDEKSDFFISTKFSVVIASQLSEKLISSLSKFLWNNEIPFIYMHCIGFYGWVRVQLNEQTIIESHPDASKDDLRIDHTFPELSNFINNYTIGGREDGIKTPWLIFLLKGIQSFINHEEIQNNLLENGDQDQMEEQLSSEVHPCLMKSEQKRKFKKYLRNFLLQEKFGLKENDEIFEDVLKTMNKALCPTKIPSHVNDILKDPKVNKPENKFWIMCSALNQFVIENGVLPVSGVIPDMIADSKKYISLQNIYRGKAAKDSDDMDAKCQEIIRQSGLQINFSAEEIRLFCKEAHNLGVIRGSDLASELDTIPTSILNELVQNPEYCDSNKILYAMFRGVLRFHSEYNTYPGLLDQDVETDIAHFKTILTKLLNEWNITIAATEDYIHEICRLGNSELPSVAGFIGGCVAQEAIKIITSQYIPLNDTFIYNGNLCTSTQFKVISLPTDENQNPTNTE